MATVDEIRHGITTRPATVTSTVDGRDHLISAHATAAGLAAGRGEYVALCGRAVVAAPLVVPPGPTCFDCETALHRITTGTTTAHRRRGLVARLLSRSFPRAESRSTTSGSHRAVRA
jgi:hypothetical protein